MSGLLRSLKANSFWLVNTADSLVSTKSSLSNLLHVDVRYVGMETKKWSYQNCEKVDWNRVFSKNAGNLIQVSKYHRYQVLKTFLIIGICLNYWPLAQLSKTTSIIAKIRYNFSFTHVISFSITNLILQKPGIGIVRIHSSELEIMRFTRSYHKPIFQDCLFNFELQFTKYTTKLLSRTGCENPFHHWQQIIAYLHSLPIKTW